MLTNGMPCVTHMAFHVSLTWLAMCHHMVRHVSPDTRFLKIREIPTISEFNEIQDFTRRFQRCNPFCHPRSRKISTFLQTISVNYRFPPFYLKNLNLNSKFSRVLHKVKLTHLKIIYIRLLPVWERVFV